MCGIVGEAYSDPRRPGDRERIVRLLTTLVHRGPDQGGVYADDGVALGARRLAVQDPEGGHQPASDAGGRVHAVLNGEIYNYPALRADLESRGYRFRSRADSEVLVHLYAEHGTDFVDRLRGMFAVALWDSETRRLVLVRDRIGQKPLHYALLGDRLVFASELRTLIAHGEVPCRTDPHAVDATLRYDFVPGTSTPLLAVKRLPPACRAVYEDGELRIEPYWRFSPKPDPRPSIDEWAERFRAALGDAVERQLLSDVPLGVLLSGGVDSSALVALLRERRSGPIKTFSLAVPQSGYDERDFARAVATRFETEHHEALFDPDPSAITRDLVETLDEPLADTSCLPTLALSGLARGHVTVALGGDGGDELAGGYDTYVADALARSVDWLPQSLRTALATATDFATRPQAIKKGPINRLRRFTEGLALPAELGHLRWSTFLAEAEARELYTAEFRAALGDTADGAAFAEARAAFQSSDPVTRALAIDATTYLPDDILLKVDRMGMAASLEVRAPWLDEDVVDLFAAMPPSLKVSGTSTKRLVRRALQGRLPTEILRREKQGFSVPVKSWLRGPLAETMRETLSPRRLNARGFVRPAVVARWMHEHGTGRRDHAHRLWSLMLMELWQERWLDGGAKP